ncbi:hypothetical protein R3W88_022672 [Solanum pinnatisectum]|uniref:Uncharacterized protein n=1 Tax=Solanum pinnatisectum TaxID=50273 RepID=A0AAV9LV90_9SOLN|nr:hypothetical protein R3W88_022672 [Solanum pinnatisectum]
MPNTISKGAPLIPYDRELSKTICKMVNAQELETQRQRLELEVETAARAHMVFEEDYLDLASVGATGAIVLLLLPLGVKFNSTSTMIQLLNLKGMFRGVTSDDSNQHLMNFVAICKSSNILGVRQSAMRLRLFLLYLGGRQQTG